MSDPMHEDPHGTVPPKNDARSPAPPNPPETVNEPSAPSEEQLLLEERVRRSLRDVQLQNEAKERSYTTSSGFTVQRGGRSTMVETAGKIGAAVGTAQREVRRKLELVRSSSRTVEPATEEPAERGARVVPEFEEDTGRRRRDAGERLENWSEQAEARILELRRQVRTIFWRSGLRAREIADTYPLQTIGAVAGTFFILGIALRLGRSHRG